MRLKAFLCVLALGGFAAAANAQQAAVRTEGTPPQSTIAVSGWPAGSFACTVNWSETPFGEETAAASPRTDTRRVAGLPSYEITTAQRVGGVAISCTPDTPPGVTPTPEGCRELIRPAYGAIPTQGDAQQFRTAHPGASMVFRIALTPNAEGVPENLNVVAQQSTDVMLIEQWGDRLADQIHRVAAQGRFTPECAGARIMLPYTLR